MRFLVRLVSNAVALWVAVAVVRGLAVTASGGWTFGQSLAGDSGAAPVGQTNTGGLALAFLLVALAFTVVNSLVRPVVNALAFPLRLLTLGLFSLVVNALMLELTAWVTRVFPDSIVRFSISGFWAAFFGAIVVGVVNWLIGLVVPLRSGRG